MRCFYFLYSKSLYCSKKQAEKNKDVNFMQNKAGSFDFNTDSNRSLSERWDWNMVMFKWGFQP